MNVSLYQAAAALDANKRWQEVIAQNLSASAVPGFKKQSIAFEAKPAGVMPGDSTTGAPPQPFTLPSITALTSFRPGEIKLTGVKTDLAIDGPGFFTVQMPDGSTGYTRDGEFRLNAQGQVVTKSGYPLLGGGSPIQVALNSPAPIVVAPGGEVSQDGQPKGRIELIEFADPNQLTPLGGGLFVAEKPNDPNAPTVSGTTATNSSVRQGLLEVGNVSTVEEMAHMITAMRAFEANQRIIQLQDERLGRAIHELSGAA